MMEDLRVRDYVKKQLAQAAVSKVVIERFANRVRVTIYSGRPGLVIGRKGAEIDNLKNDIARLTGGKEIYLDIKEIKTPELDAQLVAENIAVQMSRRVSFRRAMKRAMKIAMDLGVDGIKVRAGGRLGGERLQNRDRVA